MASKPYWLASFLPGKVRIIYPLCEWTKPSAKGMLLVKPLMMQLSLKKGEIETINLSWDKVISGMMLRIRVHSFSESICSCILVQDYSVLSHSTWLCRMEFRDGRVLYNSWFDRWHGCSSLVGCRWYWERWEWWKRSGCILIEEIFIYANMFYHWISLEYSLISFYILFFTFSFLIHRSIRFFRAHVF